MSLIVGTNSWSTIAEADAYLTDRINASAWFLLSDQDDPGELSKESLLVSSFYWLFGAPDLEISKSSSDSNVKNAQIEAALWLLTYSEQLEERRAAMFSGLSSFRYSKRSENFNPSLLKIPPHITGLLSEYLNSNGTALLLGEYDV